MLTITLYFAQVVSLDRMLSVASHHFSFLFLPDSPLLPILIFIQASFVCTTKTMVCEHPQNIHLYHHINLLDVPFHSCPIILSPFQLPNPNHYPFLALLYNSMVIGTYLHHHLLGWLLLVCWCLLVPMHSIICNFYFSHLTGVVSCAE
jgi:hypothetical protein